ncbi:MAG: BRCT domain-containing protein, partial [Candidatus Aminicenantales bacterium]
QPENAALLRRLKEAGLEFKPEAWKSGPKPLAGKTFVFTGTLTKFERDRAKELINQRGGKVTATVSSKTDYLVVGESPGSKLVRAKELGIAILNEDGFLNLVGE